MCSTTQSFKKSTPRLLMAVSISGQRTVRCFELVHYRATLEEHQPASRLYARTMPAPLLQTELPLRIVLRVHHYYVDPTGSSPGLLRASGKRKGRAGASKHNDEFA